MTATTAAPRTLTYTVDRLIPGLHRVRCTSAQSHGGAWFESDPCLSPWAAALVAEGHTQQLAQAHTLNEALAAAGLDALPLEHAELAPDGAVSVSFALSDSERLYGAYDADASSLNRRGDVVNLVTELHPVGHHNMPAEAGSAELPVAPIEIGESSNYGELHLPIVLSSRGYGVYIANHRSRAQLDLGAADPTRWTFTAADGPVDLFIIGPGMNPVEIARTLSRLLGEQPLPPVWAFGYLQSRFGYESFDHVEGVVRRLREERLPVHGVVLDVQWFAEHVNLQWNQDGFADAPKRLADLHDLGVRVVAITEPGTGGSASNYAAGVEGGHFARAVDSDEVYPSDQWYCVRGIPGYREIVPAHGGLVNFFNEDASDWWYDQHRHLSEAGIDAWWLDLNEPEDVLENVRFTSTDWPESSASIGGFHARNLFALAQQRAFTNRDLADSDRRPFLLSRSGAAGSQRYGASPWSGDVGATWADLQRQPHLLLSAGTCGVPLWGCDVGGFFGEPGGELFARWVQLGAWLPVMRAHGCMSDREPWSQGDESLAALRASIVLRGQLLPMISSWARRAFADGLPLCRPMWMDYPDDERFAEVFDQWMFGDILVAPVLEQGVDSRTVELPDGEWVDLWTGARHPGGGTLTMQVELGTNPAFVRAGSLLVVDLEPTEHRAMAWPPAALGVWAFPDSDGYAEGSLIVDDGLTRKHERGAYADVKISVVEGKLEVERTAGSFPLPRLTVTSANPGIAG